MNIFTRFRLAEAGRRAGLDWPQKATAGGRQPGLELLDAR